MYYVGCQQTNKPLERVGFSAWQLVGLAGLVCLDEVTVIKLA